MALQDGKLFYKISEVASHLGVTASTLRFWEKEIPNLKPRTNKKRESAIYTRRHR